MAGAVGLSWRKLTAALKLPRRPAVEILYFIRWGPMRMQRDGPFARPLPLEEARALYDRRGLHTALVLREGQPYATIESQNKAIKVVFFDALVRGYLRYWFDEVQPGRLFLDQATFIEFDGETPDIAIQDIYMFKSSGELIARKQDMKQETVAETNPRQVDISGNWEPYPEFGRYAGLRRTDRPGH